VYERFTLLAWGQVRRYELTGTEVITQTIMSRKSAPSQLRTHASSVLVLHTATDQLVVRSPLAPSHVRQLLSRDLAVIDQRAATFVAPSAAPSPGPSSLADELAKLARLHAQGALTDGEFAAQKARLRTAWGGSTMSGAEERVHCRFCYTENLSSARKCDHCGAPLTGANGLTHSRQVAPAATGRNALGSTQPAQPLSVLPPPAEPQWPATQPIPKPRKRHHLIRNLLLGIVALIVIVVVLLAVFSGPRYTVSDISVLALNSSAIDVGFKLANNGVSSGRPKCAISVSVPGGINSTRSFVLPTLKVGHTYIVRHIDLAVAEQRAHQITKQDVAISC
jgi:hypothetical protein